MAPDRSEVCRISKGTNRILSMHTHDGNQRRGITLFNMEKLPISETPESYKGITGEFLEYPNKVRLG